MLNKQKKSKNDEREKENEKPENVRQLIACWKLVHAAKECRKFARCAQIFLSS